MKKIYFIALVLLLASVVYTHAKAADGPFTETPMSMKTFGGTLSGTLTMPNSTSGKVPVVLIIPGSGSVDRDGNNPSINLSANTYKMLAYALANAGIASVRYDKRMIGQSTSVDKEKNLNIEDYVDDAVSWLNALAGDDRFSAIIIAGHEQGALVGMMASHDEPIKGYISIEGAGQPEEKMLTLQMQSQPDYKAADIKRMLDSLKKGKTYDRIDLSLYPIARPSIQALIMSWCRYDPVHEIRAVKCPVMLIQGTTDLQISVDNSSKLKSGKSGAQVMIIRGMNYILKDAPADREQNMATYGNPDLPLNKEMVTDIITFVQSVK